MKLTTKEIMEIIPHRHPFLLIDTIEELVPGVKATGKKCVTAFCRTLPTGTGYAGSSDR